MTIKAPEHVWRTEDGRHVVGDGHPEARFLAYPTGEDVPDDVAREVGFLKEHKKEAPKPHAPKEASKPPNKAFSIHSDK